MHRGDSGDQRSTTGVLAEPFEAFYRREYRSVFGVLLMVTADRQDAEDVAQDAFSRAYARWESVARLDNPGAWVRRVALNRAISIWRRGRTARVAAPRLAADLRPTTLVADGANEAIWREVSRLPRRQAQVVALRYVEDRALDEIAVILGVSVGSVKTHLHRAHNRLNRRLDKEG